MMIRAVGKVFAGKPPSGPFILFLKITNRSYDNLPKPTARIHDIEILSPIQVGRSITPRTVRYGIGILKQKGPADQGETYTLRLTEQEFENLYDLVWNGTFGVAYIQLPETMTENQLRIITGMRAEYKKNQMINCTLITQRVRHETALRVMTQEFATAWDTIVEGFATAKGVWSEDTQSTVTGDGHYWYAEESDWSIHADDYLLSSEPANYHSCLLRNTSGHDFIMSDGTVKVTSQTNTFDERGGLWIRAQRDPAGTTYGYGYVLQIVTDTTPADSVVNFNVNKGADDNTLWSRIMTLDRETSYTLKVIAQGDRFDLFFEGEYQATVYDTTYSAGLIGVHNTSFACYHSNFSFSLIKPGVTPFPVGAHGINQHLTHSVYSNEGKINYAIGTQGETTFSQRTPMIASDACAFWLPLDEGYGTPVDHSGYEHTNTLWNGASWVEGDDRWTQKGIRVVNDSTATPDALLVGVTDPIYFNGPYSIFFRAEFENNGNTHYAMYAKDRHNRTGGMALWYAVAESLFYVYHVPVRYDIPWEITYDQVLDICITYDGATVTAYVNGIAVGNIAATSGPTGNIRNIFFGSNENGSGYVTGNYYHVAGWERALTADEVAFLSRGYGDLSGGECRAWDTAGYELSDQDLIGRWHMDEGRWRADGTVGYLYDSSGNGHDSTAMTAPAWITNGSFRPEARHCLDFTKGSSQYVSIPDTGDAFSFDGSGTDTPFTVACWFNCENLGASAHGLLSKYGGSGSREWITYLTLNGNIDFFLCNPTGANYIYQSTPQDLVAGLWYFFVATYDGSEHQDGLNIYINGQLHNGASGGSGYTGMTGTAQPLYLGRYDTYYMDGLIDQPEVWGREMPAAEIATRYQLGPILHDHANWRRLYAPMSTKALTGHLVAENGLTRIEIIPRDGQNPLVKSYAFTDGCWKFVGQTTIQWSINDNMWPGTYGSQRSINWDVRVTEITRDRISIEMTSTISTDEEQDNMPLGIRIILRSGFSGYLTESIYPLTYNLLATGLSNDYTTGGRMGSSLMPRFAWVPGNNPFDAMLDGNTGYTSSDDNYIIWFDPNLDVIYTGFKNQANDAVQGFYILTHATEDRIRMVEPFGTDTLAPYYRGGVAFSQHDTNMLWTWMESATSGVLDNFNTNNSGDNVTAASVGVTSSGGYICRLNADGEYVRSKNFWDATARSWQAGTYIIWWRFWDNTGAGTIKLSAYNDSEAEACPGGDEWSFSPNGGADFSWYAQVFQVKPGWEDDTIYGKCELDVAGGNVVYVDQCVMFPVSNGHNRPLDLAHQAMRSQRLEYVPKK